MKWVVIFQSLFILATANAGEVPERLELQDRRVDQAALQSKKKAIDQLKKLILRHRGTEQEPLMWVKLAEFQQQSSGIEFRIAHGQAHRGQSSPKLNRYVQSLQDVIATTTHLIQKFSKEVNIDQIYSMRGSAYEELKKKESAKKDYLYLVQNFPDSPWASQSYMALAEFAIEENQHDTAIRFLKAVEALPDDSHYPFALYKLAWSHFNLKHITTSIDYLKKHIQYYKDSTEESDRAILEHSLLDLTSFYLQGFEDHLPDYTTAQALNDFRKIENGPSLGQMAFRYAKLLRAHTHDTDLLNWKNQLIHEEYQRPETLDVILLTMDYFLNNKQLDRVLECAANIAQVDQLSKKTMRTFLNYPAIQTQILAVSDRLQKMILKNKNATELNPLIHALQGVYQSFIDIAQIEDSRVPRIHYNLAETLFQIKDFERSSDHYLWVFQHYHKKDGLDRKDILLKLISSKYQTLNQKMQIPKDVAAHQFDPEKKDSPSDVKPEISQWISWLDEFLDDYGYDRPEIETFEFEANRTLYSQNQTVESLKRLKKAIHRNPKSKISIASASLIIDTYITSNLWSLAHEEAHNLTELFQDQGPSHSDFLARMKTIESDSYYKLIESDYQKREYKEALKKIRKFQKNYSASARY
jgi:tetratricopeptide (TPR) repeat protein